MNEDQNVQKPGEGQAPPSPGAVIGDFQPAAVMPPETQKSKRSKLVLLVPLIVMLAMVIGASYWLLSISRQSGSSPLSRGSNKQLAKSTGSPLIGEALANNYRVYRSVPASERQQTATYTLADEKGNRVKSDTNTNILEMLTPVGSDKFLFSGETADYQTAYTLFDKDGFRQLTNLPASMDDPIGHGPGGPVGLTSFDEDTVIFQYCKDTNSIREGEDPYQCDLRSVNLTTGQETIMTLSSDFKEYNARLLTFSSDKKYAYFLGTSKSDAAAFKKEADKITGGQLRYETDPEIQKIYELKRKQSIVKLDLASQKVVSNKTVELQYTYYQKFWLSPNGEHLVYSNGGERGELQYVSVADGKTGTIKLPAPDQATEPWGGSTTTYDPLFSDKGDHIAYVTYVTQSGKFLQSMGVIDLKKKTAKEYATQPAGSNGSGFDSHFDNMRWIKTNQLEMSGGSDNYQVDIARGTAQKLESALGQLVGYADSYR